MTYRVECLIHAARYEETLLWSARALQLAPDDPGFIRWAGHGLDLAMKHRLWRKHPEVKIPPRDACRHNFHGTHEQTDLQRFLKRHDLSRRISPRFPAACASQRRFKLFCKPEEEVITLLQLADQFELKGELLKTRDALHDLYLLDPAQSGVFVRARLIESSPKFQVQLKALIANRSRIIFENSSNGVFHNVL